MRTRRCQPNRSDNLFLRYPDLSGALIQAFENSSTVRHIHRRHSMACNSLDDTSFLRYISSFVVKKAGQQSSHQLFRAALSISRTLHKKCHCTFHGLRALRTTVLYSPCANLDSETITSHVDCTVSQQTLSEPHHTPTTTASYRPTARREGVRASSLRRSTFCGPPIASISKPGLKSPIHSQTQNSVQDLPLTPINQILSTPLHPPRIENKGQRTAWDSAVFDRECDFTCVSLANSRSPEEIPYLVYQPNRRLSFRNRLWVRRLSHPHFKDPTASHLLSSPLMIPDITNAPSACHQLASPLNIRSSTSTPCASQTMEDGHLQWSPHCLQCFA